MSCIPQRNFEKEVKQQERKSFIGLVKEKENKGLITVKKPSKSLTKATCPNFI